MSIYVERASHVSEVVYTGKTAEPTDGVKITIEYTFRCSKERDAQIVSEAVDKFRGILSDTLKEAESGD